MKHESLDLVHRLAGLIPDPATEENLLREMAAITDFCRELPAAAGSPEPERDSGADTSRREPDRPLGVPFVRANAPRMQGGLFIAPTPKPGSAS